jgi:hypothetical protein
MLLNKALAVVRGKSLQRLKLLQDSKVLTSTMSGCPNVVRWFIRACQTSNRIQEVTLYTQEYLGRSRPHNLRELVDLYMAVKVTVMLLSTNHMLASNLREHLDLYLAVTFLLARRTLGLLKLRESLHLAVKVKFLLTNTLPQVPCKDHKTHPHPLSLQVDLSP